MGNQWVRVSLPRLSTEMVLIPTANTTGRNDPTRQSVLLPSSSLHRATDLGGAGIIQEWGKWDQVINAKDGKPADDLAQAGTTDWTSVRITGYTEGHPLLSETQWDQYTCNVLDWILAWSLPLSESVVGIWALHIPTQQVCDSIGLEIWQCVIRRQQLLVGELDNVDSNTQNLFRRVTGSPSELRELALRGVGRLCLEKDRAGILTGVWLPSLSCQFPPLNWGLNEGKPWRLHNDPQASFCSAPVNCTLSSSH